MADLVISQILGLIVGFLALIPAGLLLRQFLKTKIRDYFLFFLFFADAFLTLTLDVVAGYTKILYIIELNHITIDIIYLLLTIHATRIIWKSTPKPVLVVTFVWFFALMFMTLMWAKIPAVNSGNWLGIPNFPISFSDYAFTASGQPYLAAGLVYNGIIIYGTQFRIFGDLFRIYAVGFLLYAYITAKPLNPTPRILTAKKIWIVVWIMLLLHAIVLFPPFGASGLANLVGFILIIAGALITYIAIFIPEAILISRVQVQRIFDLYDKLQKASSDEEIEKLQIESLMMYLKSVKSALKDESHSD